MRALISWECVGLAVDVDRPVGAHVALHRPDRAVGVGDRLALRDLADEDLAGLRERDHRRGGAGALGVGDDDGLARLEDRDDRVGGAEVDADGLGHGVPPGDLPGRSRTVDSEDWGNGVRSRILSASVDQLSERADIPDNAGTSPRAPWRPARSPSDGPGRRFRPHGSQRRLPRTPRRGPALLRLLPKELHLVARRAEDVQVPAGNVLVQRGRDGRRVLRDPLGHRQGRRAAAARSRRLGPGAFFGDLALLDKAPRNATVTAETDMELVVLGQREFAGLLDEVPGFARKLLAGLAAPPARGRRTTPSSSRARTGAGPRDRSRSSTRRLGAVE